jgi:anti-sigma B factor antagonist
MELAIHIDHDDCTIILDGDLDASSSIQVDQAIEHVMHANVKNILINFHELDYISAAGLGVFISHINSMHEKDITLVLFDMSEKIKNIFTVTGLDKIIPIVSSAEDAHLLCKQKTCNN